MKTKADIFRLIEEEDVEFIRLQFTDIFGNLKNVAVTEIQLEKAHDNYQTFDGSIMYGTMRYGLEDVYLYPDFDTFVILPWRPQCGKVARMLCDVKRGDESPYNMCSRTILKNVIKSAEEKGYTFYIEPECEFFLFHTDENGKPTTLTHEKAGYMDVGPIDLGENARREMVLNLEEMGFEIESSHHESAPAQHEIDFREGEPLQIADSIVTFKYAVRSTAKRFGLHATFMPKPQKDVEGSGMHLNFAVYKDGRNIFNKRDKNVEYTDEAQWFMAGIMKHAKAMCSITNPLVNSYKRLTSGFELSNENKDIRKRQNAILKVRNRVGQDTKIELRFPDPSANPYLALAVCMAAGMDGLENHLELNKESISCENKDTRVGYLPITLREAVRFTKEDEFIRSILGEEFLETYTELKYDEWNEYMEQISDWEIEKYLNRV